MQTSADSEFQIQWKQLWSSEKFCPGTGYQRPPDWEILKTVFFFLNFQVNAFKRRRTILLRISTSSVEGQPSEKTKAAAARGACCLSGGWSSASQAMPIAFELLIVFARDRARFLELRARSQCSLQIKCRASSYLLFQWWWKNVRDPESFASRFKLSSGKGDPGGAVHILRTNKCTRHWWTPIEVSRKLISPCPKTLEYRIFWKNPPHSEVFDC